MKIYLELIEEPMSGKCAVTGKKVSFTKGYGFFADGVLSKPVDEAEALSAGFTMNKKTLGQLAALIDDGKKFEEVQKSAHEEFKDV